VCVRPKIRRFNANFKYPIVRQDVPIATAYKIARLRRISLLRSDSSGFIEPAGFEATGVRPDQRRQIHNPRRVGQKLHDYMQARYAA
jgi:hypothetical protein